MGAGGLEHGGDAEAALAAFPRAPRPLVDLSTGISPIPYPLPALPARAFTHLPAASDVAGLEAAARAAYGVAPGNGLVAAPGTQILIELLPRLVPRSRVAIVSPTYGEHAHAWRKTGHQVAEVGGLDDAAGADVVVLVDPNNPDGRRHPPDAIRAAAAGRRLVVVDEAFADFEERASIAASASPGIVVLRSFGKSYGLAGVRLGFAVGDQALVEALRAALGPWAVSGPAIAIGTAALVDAAWRAELSPRLGAIRAALVEGLVGTGCAIEGGTLLYVFVRHDRAVALADHLARAGVAVRRFAARPSHLRFGLPSDGETARVLAALASFR
jgi:cobalamin biosynthetic protein CobC